MSQQKVDSPTLRNAEAHGGVALPPAMAASTDTSSATTRYIAAGDGAILKVVGWQGPQPGSTVSHPFPVRGGFAAARAATKKLKGEAASFQPTAPLMALTKPSPIAMLNRGSVADGGYPVIVESSKAKAASDPIGAGMRQISPKTKVVFTTDVGCDVKYAGSHYVTIEKVLATEFDEGMSTLNEEFNWASKIWGQNTSPPAQTKRYMTMFLCFDDLRFTAEAIQDVGVVNQNWEVRSITQPEFAANNQEKPDAYGQKSEYFDGQVIYSAVFEGNLAEISTNGLATKVRDLAEKHGEVFAFAETSQPNSQACEFRVEYYKISDAKEVLALITTAQPYTVDEWAVAAKKVINPTLQVPAAPLQAGYQNREVFCSVTGRTSWSYDKDGNTIIEQPAKSVPKVGSVLAPGDFRAPLRDQRLQSAPLPSLSGPFGRTVMQARSASWASGEAGRHEHEPQAVIISYIENGQDVRTTIMLRNLPNGWTVHDLIRVLNVTSKNKYDFSYLRIDFNWNTNVGYGFVNFTAPEHIIEFVKYYVGKNWSGSAYPRKTAQVSYATIQGYDCLVEKFRNSAVMDEYADFRPKLWYTPENAPNQELVGSEMPFPPPNNMSKKQRSHDNAGQIGLYAPRTGLRGGDRLRHSNWDRGTPRQIQEDAAYQGHAASTAVGFYHGGHYVAEGVHGPVGAPYPPPTPFYGNFTPYPMGYGDGYGHPPYSAPLFPPAGFPWGYPTGPINPASRLRSQGKLHVHPRIVAVGTPQGTRNHGAPVPHANVPRTFGNSTGQQSTSSSRVEADGDVEAANYVYVQQPKAQY